MLWVYQQRSENTFILKDTSNNMMEITTSVASIVEMVKNGTVVLGVTQNGREFWISPIKDMTMEDRGDE